LAIPFLTLLYGVFLLHIHRRASAHISLAQLDADVRPASIHRRPSTGAAGFPWPGPAQFSAPSPFILSVLHTMFKSISFEPYFQMPSILYENLSEKCKDHEYVIHIPVCIMLHGSCMFTLHNMRSILDTD
jgi:hypothetical protein